MYTCYGGLLFYLFSVFYLIASVLYIHVVYMYIIIMYVKLYVHACTCTCTCTSIYAGVPQPVAIIAIGEDANHLAITRRQQEL